MAREVIELLAIRPGGYYVDATAGAGGHASLIAERLEGRGHLLALDQDPRAVAMSTERLREYPETRVLRGNYRELGRWLDMVGWTGIDGLLIDAGVSSMQLDTPERGFSLQTAGPLDMRMDPEQGRSARQWLNDASLETLEQVLRNYGDVKPARRIARLILEYRDRGILETTSDLAQSIREALPFVTSGTPDEIRQVFQAIRIAVNDELNALQDGLETAVNRLNPGGRIVVIAFHSGEDRIIKQVFRKYTRTVVERYPDGRTRRMRPALLRELTGTPLRPSPEEITVNPRSASARIRAAEKCLRQEEAPI